jgi:hypothetical protein
MLRPEKPQLFDIWENPERETLRWHVMMVNYVAHFNTKEETESFVVATQRAREQDAKSVRSK